MHIDLLDLGERLANVLKEQERYQMDLVIKEFDGADFLFFYVLEPHTDQPPTFYFITSPWDAKSNAAPQGAQVFSGGSLVLQLDYTEYVKVRTGLMDACALRALGRDPSKGRVLYIGAGGVAEWSLRALKAYFPNVQHVQYTNRSGVKESFEQASAACGVVAEYVAQPDIASYEYIFMHTSSRVPVLLAADCARIAEGAVISIFSDKHEAALEVYERAALLVNWQQSFTKEADLIQAVAEHRIDPTQARTMRDILDGAALPAAHHTVFRSGGTPMQNIAMLQYIREHGVQGV